MELRSFVKTALLDVIAGVKDAQSETDAGTIVPAVTDSKYNYDLGLTALQILEFEVSVTAEESSGSEGKLGVVNAFIGAGISGKSAKGEGSASVIRFKIPVQFPMNGNLKQYSN